VELPDPVPVTTTKYKNINYMTDYLSFDDAVSDSVGRKLIVNDTVVLKKSYRLKSILLEGVGRGADFPQIICDSIQGDCLILDRDCELTKLNISNKNSSGFAISTNGVRTSLDDLWITGFWTGGALAIRDHSFYISIKKVIANINNGTGILFSTPAGSVDDNGQLGIDDCTFDGARGAITRIAEAATMHRIDIRRTQLSGGSNADYICNFTGVGDLSLTNVDVESSGTPLPKLGMMRISGLAFSWKNGGCATPVIKDTVDGINWRAISFSSAFGSGCASIENIRFYYLPKNSYAIDNPSYAYMVKNGLYDCGTNCNLYKNPTNPIVL
jgi:hypothetical protein